MASLALGPVSVAVYAALNVAGLTALVGSRIYDDLPQGVQFPCVLYRLDEREQRGLGTVGFPEVRLRVHAFSTYEGAKEAQSIIQKVIELLRDQSLTVAGYALAGKVFYDDTISIGLEAINNVKVYELVANFRIYVEEA